MFSLLFGVSDVHTLKWYANTHCLQVLKSKDYLEVKQEEPYADILLSPTPKLNKAKF